MNQNPFITSGYAGAEYFCDREQETQNMLQMLTNGNNLALISPRRLGKTDLMRHVFAQKEIQEKYYTFIVDIYSTSSLEEMTDKLGKAVLEALKPFGRKVWEEFLNILVSLRPAITYDQFGNPTWSVGVGQIANPIVTLDEIFKYLSIADRPCLVVIDEFQQITKYTDASKVEAQLRTYVQYCANAHFVFSGSARHLMGEMFLTPTRPFYQSVLMMNLQPIPQSVYVDFCEKQFAKYDRQLHEGVAEDVYQRFEGVTYYMQRVMNVLFSRTIDGDICTKEDIDAAIQYLMDMYSIYYEDLLYQLPEKQRIVLQAIAMDGKAKNITSTDFVKKHHLSSASSVNSAVKALLERDLVTVSKGVYQVYDQFLELWIQRKK